MTLIHGIQANDSPSIDAFSRWRVSSPTTLFESKFAYDLAPLQYEAITSSGTITHDPTNAKAVLSISSALGLAALQSYRWIRYQPGKSQMVLITFKFGTATTNSLKTIGLFSSTNSGATLARGNGIFFQQGNIGAGGILTIGISNLGTQTPQYYDQSQWNLDKLDGSGPSGVTLDITKNQILVIDLQWLGVGRVRVGFDIGGVVIYAHQFLNANSITNVYMQTATLPIRAEASTIGTGSCSMDFICAAVISEGGSDDINGYEFSTEFTGTAGNGTRVHLGSFRRFLTFNSLTPRYPIIPLNIDTLVTGSNPVLFEIVMGATFSAGPTWAGAAFSAYSGAEITTAAGTIATTPIVAYGFYNASGAQTKTQVGKSLSDLYPIALNANGANIALGTLSIYATGFSGTSACRASLQWKEIR